MAVARPPSPPATSPAHYPHPLNKGQADTTLLLPRDCTTLGRPEIRVAAYEAQLSADPLSVRSALLPTWRSSSDPCLCISARNESRAVVWPAYRAGDSGA